MACGDDYVPLLHRHKDTKTKCAVEDKKTYTQCKTFPANNQSSLETHFLGSWLPRCSTFSRFQTCLQRWYFSSNRTGKLISHFLIGTGIPSFSRLTATSHGEG
ncbi:hypothetical protein XENOCAPTIV_011326 [Xenoophorus captivus]|uniref:Uncharacterized protein n=1 Tax=Xenoophorus captivus TaxID=1517983 RepID=A0ABV0QR83_9TELE